MLAVILMTLGMAAASVGLTLAWMGRQGQVDAKTQWEEQRTIADGQPHVLRTSVSLSRLSFPSLNREFFVAEGASERNLLLGPVHVGRSAAPGEMGNCIIAAHRDTHFRILNEVHKGDEISIEWAGKLYRYRAVSLAIVPAEDDRFYRQERQPLLTLVTCYPFYYVGPAPKRFIVRARLI